MGQVYFPGSSCRHQEDQCSNPWRGGTPGGMPPPAPLCASPGRQEQGPLNSVSRRSDAWPAK
eukprot:11223856-Karenia_brevis.AAC.1